MMRWLAPTGDRLYRSRRKLATTAVVLGIVALGYHVVFGANGALVYAQKRTEHRRLDQELILLQQENERLARHIHALKTDPKTIEKEAREQLKYTRPGEVVFTVPEDPRWATKTASEQPPPATH